MGDILLTGDTVLCACNVSQCGLWGEASTIHKLAANYIGTDILCLHASGMSIIVLQTSRPVLGVYMYMQMSSDLYTATCKEATMSVAMVTLSRYLVRC